MSIYERAKELLTPHKPFGQPAEEVSRLVPRVPRNPQMILRMMVRNRSTNGWQIPGELDWLAPTILACDKLQVSHGIRNPFVYITVRHGPVISETDDLWHVDGFSMRVPHPPEQNYIWSSCFGTETLPQKMELPADFDPMKHNIHQYFQDRADSRMIHVLRPMTLYAIDPYVIHRRPSLPRTVNRTFFRISFVPIEIEDDTCTINPLIPRLRPYGRKDIRLSLTRYQG